MLHSLFNHSRSLFSIYRNTSESLQNRTERKEKQFFLYEKMSIDSQFPQAAASPHEVPHRSMRGFDKDAILHLGFRFAYQLPASEPHQKICKPFHYFYLTIE